MFDDLKAKDKLLTTLDLGTPPPSKPRPEAAPSPGNSGAGTSADPKQQAPTPCLALIQNVEGTYAHFAGARLKYEAMVSANVQPEVMSYVVFPQQGLTHSFTTGDGLKTIVPLFTSRLMAEAYISAKKLPAVPAACRVEKLPSQAERWSTSGINAYTLNMCCRCLSLLMFPIAELESREAFVSTWRLDLANRRQFAETTGRNTHAAIGKNPKQARALLEGVRDHIDPANPYLHWVIAVLAGMDGDMQANADSIKRLDAFGPPFTGKLQGTSFHPTEPGSQLLTMPEAIVGLGISLGYLDPKKLHP